MLNAAQIQQLKRTNISVDAEKTKQRTESLWKATKIKQKQAIRELAGVSAQTIYRIYDTGSISAKLVIALAQSRDISPYYLTGEVDDPGEFSEEVLRELLLRHGYQRLLAEIELAEVKPKRPYTRRPKQEETEPEAEEAEPAEPAAPIAPAPAQQLPPNSAALTEEDLQLLLHALSIQAKAGIASAKEKLEKILLVLLT